MAINPNILMSSMSQPSVLGGIGSGIQQGLQMQQQIANLNEKRRLAELDKHKQEKGTKLNELLSGVQFDESGMVQKPGQLLSNLAGGGFGQEALNLSPDLQQQIASKQARDRALAQAEQKRKMNLVRESALVISNAPEDQRAQVAGQEFARLSGQGFNVDFQEDFGVEIPEPTEANISRFLSTGLPLEERKFASDKSFKEEKLEHEKEVFEWQKGKPFRDIEIEQGQLRKQLPEILQGQVKKNTTLTPKAANFLVEATTLTPDVLKQISKIKNVVGDKGIQFLRTKGKAEAEAMIRQLQATLKGEQFFNLGVLTGPDLDFLSDITGDPVSGVEALLKFGSGERVNARLKTLESNIKRQFNNKLKARNLNPLSVGQFDSFVDNYTQVPKMSIEAQSAAEDIGI